MADPLSIAASLSSVITIIDALARVTSKLDHIRTQWQESELVCLQLRTQVSILRAAMSKIQEWMEDSSDESHHLLVMDLESALKCCNLLVCKLDGDIAELARNENGDLHTRSKVILILQSRGIDQVSRMLERQTSSINLLLTACNSESLSDQQRLLTKPKLRRALEKVRKDSASLIVHRDATSLVTESTDNMSKFSRVFDFDGELLSSKVYAPTIRHAFRRLSRRQKDNIDAETYALDHIEPVNSRKANSEDRKVVLLGRYNT
jgi:guanine nucleotide-binding protein G(i) subunit alpha